MAPLLNAICFYVVENKDGERKELSRVLIDKETNAILADKYGESSMATWIDMLRVKKAMMNNINTLLRDLDSLSVNPEILFDVNFKGSDFIKYSREPEYTTLQKWNDIIKKVKIIKVTGKVEKSYVTGTQKKISIKYVIIFTKGIELQLHYHYHLAYSNEMIVFGLVKNRGFYQKDIQNEIIKNLKKSNTIADVIMKAGLKYFGEEF